MLAEGVLIRSLKSHHVARRFVRVSVGTYEENGRCVAAFRRVMARSGRVEPTAPHRISGGSVSGGFGAPQTTYLADAE